MLDASSSADSDLPWVRTGEPPAGAGVCLSGGGIRAAAFAFGVIQELQERRGLMYGPDAADHVAVVSGGSYIGATLMLNASALSAAPEDGEQLPPLHEDSAEAKWVLDHSRYLIARGWGR